MEGRIAARHDTGRTTEKTFVVVDRKEVYFDCEFRKTYDRGNKTAPKVYLTRD